MDIKALYQLYEEHPCITTDSRDCPAGSIFIALKGDSFNGNQFAAQALAKGCSYAIVDDASLVKDSDYPVCTTDTLPSPGSDSKAFILVDDCLQTFKLLAREHRRQFDIPVIAITGTNGKTTTKELIRAVLSEKYQVLATEGNYNNDVGVPKTLMRLRPEHQIAVIEMGASHPGDIKTLAETAEPTCGIITNVGRAHLQGFGSFEGVVNTKCELYDYLQSRQDGLVFLNADDDILVDRLGDNLWCTPYSIDPEKQYACISGEVVSSPEQQASPFLKIRWRKPLSELEESGESQKWHKVQTQLVGNYNIYNLLAAVAVGINFDVERRAICHALESYQPTNSRSQLVVTAHNRLIVDAYNANPTSMKAAVENFLTIPLSDADHERRMLILGDMRELGAASQEEHQKLVDSIAASGQPVEVWLVGQEFARTRSSYRTFPSVAEVKAELQQQPVSGRLILVKGSNGTHLYELPPLL